MKDIIVYGAHFMHDVVGTGAAATKKIWQSYALYITSYYMQLRPYHFDGYFVPTKSDKRKLQFSLSLSLSLGFHHGVRAEHIVSAQTHTQTYSYTGYFRFSNGCV